jgi:hypothetical protein
MISMAGKDDRWGCSARFLAENGVGGAEDEKGHRKGDKDEIVHEAGWRDEPGLVAG